MKIILMQEVAGVGSAGDVAEVKDGYARNYLIPRGYAMRWTRGSESQIESLRKAKTEREIADQTSATEVAATLGSAAVVLTARAGDGGRLFGAITPADIAGAITDAVGRVCRPSPCRGQRPDQDTRQACCPRASAP